MRKALYTLIFIAFITFLFSLGLSATEDNEKYSAGHFYYHDHEGYVSICGYLGNETDISIPSNISGKPVSEIESGAFNGCDSIKTIEVPDTVMMVSGDSFTGAGSLEKIVSHTVGVTITANQGVNIDYTAEKNDQGNISTGQQGTIDTTSKDDIQTEKKDTNKETASDTDLQKSSDTNKGQSSQVTGQNNSEQSSKTTESSKQGSKSTADKTGGLTGSNDSDVNVDQGVGSGDIEDTFDQDEEVEAVKETNVTSPENAQITVVTEQEDDVKPVVEKQGASFGIVIGFALVISLLVGVIVFFVVKNKH